jgi:hypothetical protein
MEKEQRKIRLSLKPNLFCEQLIRIRRNDWKNYLTKDVKNYQEYDEGLNKWKKEDIIGATEFMNSQMTG